MMNTDNTNLLHTDGTDGAKVSGTDGAKVSGKDGAKVSGADGAKVSGTDGAKVSGTDGAKVSGTDGAKVSGTDGAKVSGADGAKVSGKDGAKVSGADGAKVSGADGAKTTEKGEAAREASEKLKKILLGGEFVKGDKLPSEYRLSERLGIGRSTLREALKLLSASGYITLIPNRGAFAKIVDENELPSVQNDVTEWLRSNGDAVGEMIEGRLCIEPFAAMLCAKNITDAALDALTDCMNRFQQAYDNRKTDELAGLDFEFHKMILTCSGNKLLSATCENLLRYFLQYSSQSNASGSRKNTVAEHRLIYEAIQAHAPEEAYAAMELHLRIAGRRVRENMEGQQENVGEGQRKNVVEGQQENVGVEGQRENVVEGQRENVGEGQQENGGYGFVMTDSDAPLYDKQKTNG